MVVLFVIANGSNLFSQSLTFSRVLALTRTSAQTDTVPVGKVWKIENFFANAYDQIYNQVRINGTQFYMFSTYSYGSAAFFTNHAPAGPIWLPAGTTIRPESSGPTYFFSIIEFTVTP